jgi:cytoskeletal protein CcmA (bactofilin family)
VLGDITSTTIVVNSGAKLQGKLQVSDGNIEQIKVPEGERPAGQEG